MAPTDIPQRSVGAVAILVPDYQETIEYFVGTLGFPSAATVVESVAKQLGPMAGGGPV